ncbi:YncE family protein [Paenibacillus rhizoplanae]
MCMRVMKLALISDMSLSSILYKIGSSNGLGWAASLVPCAWTPLRKKLYVINTREDSVSIIDLDTFKVLNTVHIGNPFVKFYPNSIFAAPKGNKNICSPIRSGHYHY